MISGPDGADCIRNWMRNRNTVEFIGLWETIHNPDFKGVEFDTFRRLSGLNSFSMTPRKWVSATGAIGILSKAGRHGGTYAHRDIAFEFGGWISPMFKLLLIKEFQRLKQIENNQLNLEWNVKRILTKTNYHFHTDAIKQHIIPKKDYQSNTKWLVYSEEADLLNVAVFGSTAKDWRDANKKLAKDGLNIRDFASVNELVVLSNMENINSVFISQDIEKSIRLNNLIKLAKYQLNALAGKDLFKSLKK